jgi:hypothetical protein
MSSPWRRRTIEPTAPVVLKPCATTPGAGRRRWGTMKKRVLLLAAIVALIAGVGIAYATTSNSGLPGGNAVWGGGHFDVYLEGEGQAPRDFSIVATPAGGEFLYGINGLPTPALGGDVTCINVSGNHAAIGGILREAYYLPDYVGYPFIWYVTDNGKLGSGSLDQVSAGFVVTKSDIADRWGGLTRSFPYVCPPFSAMSSDVSMFDLTGGDIVVQNATQNAQQ